MQPGLSPSVVNAAHSAALAALADGEVALAGSLEAMLRRYVRVAVTSFRRAALVVTAAAAEDWTPPTYHLPITSDLIDATALNGDLEEITKAYRAEVAGSVGHEMGQALGIAFDQRNRLIDGVIASQSGMKITTAPAGLVGPMMTSLQASYDAGDSIQKAARDMRAAGYAHSQAAAERIARTETIRVSNAASLAAVKTGTDLGYKVWMTSMDGRQRAEHGAADGQVVSIDGVFDVGGEALEYPGDDAGSAWNVVNCRCTVGYQDSPSVNVIAGGMSMATVETTAPSDAPAVGGQWSGVIAQEGVDTGDGRRIEKGALNWRELPLTLMAQHTTPDFGGHAEAQVAGRIDTLTRNGDNIDGVGVFDTGEWGAETERMVADGMLKGISIDLAINKAEILPDPDISDEIEAMFMGTLNVLDGTILGATIVPFPAFENATIAIVAGAAMHLSRPRKVDGQMVVSFYMPFAAPPPPAAPAKPDPMQAMQDAMDGVDSAMDALHAAHAAAMKGAGA